MADRELQDVVNSNKELNLTMKSLISVMQNSILTQSIVNNGAKVNENESASTTSPVIPIFSNLIDINTQQLSVLETISGTLRTMLDVNKESISDSARKERLQEVATPPAAPSFEGAKNLGEGLGSLFSGLGKGVAFLGLAAAGAAFASFLTFDAEKVKENVNTLLSISDDQGGKWEFFLEGGTFVAAMTTIGAGLAVFSIGQFANGIAKFATDDTWAKNIKKSVKTLLSIEDDFGGKAKFFGTGGTFGITMSAIGAGLGVFGAGQFANGIGAFANDLNGAGVNWADQIKTNVETLLSILDLPQVANGNTKAAADLFSILGSIGAGLVAFSIGKSVEGVSQFISQTPGIIADFASGKAYGGLGFGERIYKEVASLLSILDLPQVANGNIKAAANLFSILGSIGAGLVAFSIGKGVEGIVEGGQELIRGFTSGERFAQRVKDEVETLLSIADLPMSDTTDFIKTMGGIAAGLVAFSTGKGVEGLTQGVIGLFNNEEGGLSFADRIKKEVETILSIPKMAEEAGGTENLKTVLDNISNALLDFGNNQLLASLQNVGNAMLSFFSGEEGPIRSLLSLAEKSTELTMVAEALEKISKALITFNDIKIDTSKLNFEGLAEKIGAALPVIQGLAQGGWPDKNSGIIEVPGILNDIEVPKGGIFDPALRLDEFVPQMQRIQKALGMQLVSQNISPSSAALINSARLAEGSAQQTTSQTFMNSSPTTVNSSPITNNNSSTTINYLSDPSGRLDGALLR